MITNLEFGVEVWSGGAVVEGNTISEIKVTGVSVSHPDTGVQLANITVSGNNVTLCGRFGIYFGLSAGCTITNNAVANVSKNGINVLGCSDVVVSGNELTANFIDIVLDNAKGVTVTGIKISRSGGGILVKASTSCEVSGNTIENSSQGITVSESGDVKVSNNKILNSYY